MRHDDFDLPPDPMATPARELYSMGQAAAELGMARRRLQWLVQHGYIESIWLGNPRAAEGRRYICQSEIERFDMDRPEIKPGPKLGTKKLTPARKPYH